MRSIVKIYLVFLVISYALFIGNGFEAPDVFFQPETWLRWLVNFLGFFALISYAYSVDIFTKKIWLAVLVLTVGLHTYQFTAHNLFELNTLFITKATIIINYFLLVIPSVICVAYLAFRRKRDI